MREREVLIAAGWVLLIIGSVIRFGGCLMILAHFIAKGW